MMDEQTKLSKDAWDILELVRVRKYIPKSRVQEQWSPESVLALRELLLAGLIEEIAVYQLKEERDARPHETR